MSVDHPILFLLRSNRYRDIHLDVFGRAAILSPGLLQYWIAPRVPL